MFLLLAPSPLTGKRPGRYCPRGQRSQDAPKSPKGELRGWIAWLDKELHTASSYAHIHRPFKKKQKKKFVKSHSLLLSLLLFISNSIKGFHKQLNISLVLAAFCNLMSPLAVISSVHAVLIFVHRNSQT